MTRPQIQGPFKGEGVCTFCGSKDDVFVFPPAIPYVPDGPSSDKDPTACPECCGLQLDGHSFTYDRGERKHLCERCSDEPPHDWYGYDYGD